MQDKILFVLLSAFVLIDLGKANNTKEYMSGLCRWVNKHCAWYPIANRKCIPGCLGDPDDHPIIVFNQCDPSIAPDAVQEPYYLDGFCREAKRHFKEVELKEKLNWCVECDDSGLISKGLVLISLKCE